MARVAWSLAGKRWPRPWGRTWQCNVAGQQGQQGPQGPWGRKGHHGQSLKSPTSQSTVPYQETDPQCRVSICLFLCIYKEKQTDVLKLKSIFFTFWVGLNWESRRVALSQVEWMLNYFSFSSLWFISLNLWGLLGTKTSDQRWLELSRHIRSKRSEKSELEKRWKRNRKHGYGCRCRERKLILANGKINC